MKITHTLRRVSIVATEHRQLTIIYEYKNLASLSGHHNRHRAIVSPRVEQIRTAYRAQLQLAARAAVR